jgi:class 3 adenylate cyclase
VTTTFLFTDLVRSTAQWEHHPAQMSEALAIHDELVRGAVDSHGGRVFATGGDGFCAAFASPTDAVCAAAGTQRLFARQVWPAPIQLRVRMGLHTGEVDARDGDYFGPSVNRVARLMATAHGGQVVASEVTAQLIRDRLPAGVALMDLGRHRLKDLARPEQVFQLSVDGLEAVFPPLRSLDAVRTNLPVPRTSFVGREAELGHLEVLVGARRLGDDHRCRWKRQDTSGRGSRQSDAR